MDNLLALAISLIPLLNPLEKYVLAVFIKDTDSFKKLRVNDLFNLDIGLKFTKTRNERLANFDGASFYDMALNLANGLQNRGIKVISRFDERYPKTLANIYDPPFVLYSWGHWPAQDDANLAVVGTRHPSLEGKQQTAFFVRECAGGLDSIVSGLAVGIDGVAHRAALAVKAHTIAVLGSGFNNIYPSSQKNLAAQIIDSGGLLLSEYEPDTPPYRQNFPARNRIVAGLSRGVLVADAPVRSGAMITADFALENGRDVFVLSGMLNDDINGVNNLYAQGAMSLTRGDDLLTLWQLGKTEQTETVFPVKDSYYIKPAAIGSAIANDLWQELNKD
ncbi:MAG: DNA-processing protein DprA [Spirochaetaceae bacterium]|nr:DNA-processing protein DprA [Spirochaetaceae bacterium]